MIETAGRQLGVLERAALVVRSIRLSGPEEAGASPSSPTVSPPREEWGAESCEPADPFAACVHHPGEDHVRPHRHSQRIHRGEA